MRLSAFVVAALALGLNAPVAAQESGIQLGSLAPAAAVETLDGTKVDLSQFYGGKPVVLEFWATWCPLCRKLEPAMQAAREKHSSRVTFVSVGVPDNQTPGKQRAYVEQQKLTGDFVFDREGAAIKAFSVPHTSYVVVIDRNRRVVYTGVGEKQDIEAAIKKGL